MEIAYTHVVLHGILTVVFGLGAAILFFFWFITPEESGPWYKNRFFAYGLACLAVFGAGLWWWIVSGNQPWRPETISVHQIRDVVFPDDSKQQMFTCDGEHHNVTNIFGKIVEAKDWHVRRVRWATVYYGMNWSGTSKRIQNDAFFLENKNGEHQVELPIKLKDKTKENK